MGIGSGPKGSPDSVKATTLPIRSARGSTSGIRPGRWPPSDAARKGFPLMQTFQTYIVEANNRPGELARVSDAIAQRGVNIEAWTLGYGSHGALAFLGHDEKGIKNALTAEGIKYKEVPCLTIWLEDKPGTVAKTAKRLGDAGVNIEFFAPVEYKTDRRATVAIGVDEIDAARAALSDQLVEWTIPEPAMAGAAIR
jgi:hypothetical protein